MVPHSRWWRVMFYSQFILTSLSAVPSDPNGSIYLMQLNHEVLRYSNGQDVPCERCPEERMCQQIINRRPVFNLVHHDSLWLCGTAVGIYHLLLLKPEVLYTVSSQRRPLAVLYLTVPAVCLKSQDDSLIRQIVTLRGTHEYPITDVHIFKTSACLSLHSISIKHTAGPCPVTQYRPEKQRQLMYSCTEDGHMPTWKLSKGNIAVSLKWGTSPREQDGSRRIWAHVNDQRECNIKQRWEKRKT